jgi:hypothetical protein
MYKRFFALCAIALFAVSLSACGNTKAADPDRWVTLPYGAYPAQDFNNNAYTFKYYQKVNNGKDNQIVFEHYLNHMGEVVCNLFAIDIYVSDNFNNLRGIDGAAPANLKIINGAETLYRVLPLTGSPGSGMVIGGFPRGRTLVEEHNFNLPIHPQYDLTFEFTYYSFSSEQIKTHSYTFDMSKFDPAAV